MKDYVHAARNYPWLFDAIESAVAALPDEAVSDGYRLFRGLRTSTGRPVADSEALIALNALCDLGIVKRRGARYHLDKQRWHDTEQLREGIKSAIQTLADEPESTHPTAQLCVSLPPMLDPAAEHVIRENSTDLRSGMLDVIAGAQQSLLIASPFWDAGTSEEIAKLAQKRLVSGVSVTILGRFSQDLPAPVRTGLRKIAKDPNCSVLSWFEGTGNDTQTFHFKAISADRGARAYLGSANMTVSSLLSRMELGVVVTGKVAEELDRVLRVVLTLASPISL
jgi:phosphatidylserine/phosphatidylglycerophosphate/cardiolipin synthase-like enzyme